MSNIFPLIQTIYNLKNVQRIGINLFAGVDYRDIDNDATHGFLVSQLAMIIGDMALKNGVKLNMEILLRMSLYHEWGEAILGDYPDKSPSYQSYYEEDIRKINKKAEKLDRQTMMADLQERIDLDYEVVFDSQEYVVEKEIFSIVDNLALLFEIIDLKFKGYRLAWFDYLWENHTKIIKEKMRKFVFIMPLLQEIEDEYRKEKKSPNPYLTKKKFQTQK